MQACMSCYTHLGTRRSPLYQTSLRPYGNMIYLNPRSRIRIDSYDFRIRDLYGVTKSSWHYCRLSDVTVRQDCVQLLYLMV